MALAVNALFLLGVLVLLPCAAMAKGEGEDPMHRALFDHIQEIRALSKNAQGDDVAGVEQADGDWIGSLGVVDQSVEAEPAGGAEAEGDATSDLFAHIYAVQRQVQQEAEEEVAEVGGEGSERGVLEGVLGGEEKEDGVVDPLVQERFKVLEAALKGLKDEADDRPKELRVHGAEDGDVVNLLENYAQEVNLKLRPDGASREPQVEKDERHEHGHSDDHDDHEYLHGHGYGHHHHHHDHDHGDAHTNGGFSRVSDACHHKHDHSGHGHGHQHGESIKKKRFMLPEEIAEEEDLLQYGFEGPGYSNAEQPSRLRGLDLGSSFSLSIPAYTYVH